MAIAKQITFLANGYNLAGSLTSYEFSAEAEALDATNLAGTYREYEMGYKNATLSCEGLYDHDGTDEDEIHNVWSAAFDGGTEQVITASTGLLAVGGDAMLMNATQVEYGIENEIGQVIMVSAEFQSNNAVNYGKWVLGSQLDAGTTNAASIDNGAASSNGGILHAHLINDDATDVDVKVQHSTNDSDWVDLTGAAVEDLSAAHDSGSAVVAAGTTVNRYIRGVAVVTGGNTVLVGAAFARR